MSPWHHLLGITHPLGCIWPWFPPDIVGIFLGCRETQLGSSSTRSTRSPPSCPAWGQPKHRQGEQTCSCSDGKSLNEQNLAETLQPEPVNLLPVTLPASHRALDPGGESPCRREGRKLSAERC